MDAKRDNAGVVADDEPKHPPILTPKPNDDEAAIIAEYCIRFRAKKGPTILALGVQAMREALARTGAHA